MLGRSHATMHAAQRRAARASARRARRPRRAPRLRTLTAPAETGAWDAAVRPLVTKARPEGIIGIHAALLPTGKVMWFSYPKEDVDETAAVLWDPVTRTFEDVPPPIDPRTGRPLNIWCGGQSLLSDGRLLVTGGNLAYPDKSAPVGAPNSQYKGLNTVVTFDPFVWERTKDPAKAWQRHGDMRHGRWYPSQVLMPDGRTLIFQGYDETGVETKEEVEENEQIEVFDPARPNEIGLLGTVPKSMMGEVYPRMFWMPSGRALVAGPHQLNSWLLQPPALGTPVDVADPAKHHVFGSPVLLPLERDSRFGRVMQTGGSHTWYDSSAENEVFDEQAGAWSTPAGRLSVARGHHNTVLLPDDTMVAIGGGIGQDARQNPYVSTEAHKAVELYDPKTETWTLGPAQQESRAYHSTALLLPDGSVVSAGDDGNGGGDRDTYEIYRPRYFFSGRPATPIAPERAGYGKTIIVRTPDANIARAVLVAPGATTHSVDMSQRMIRLGAARPVAGGYAIDMPANANVALPGHYMLFLVDGQGRPSKADWLRLDPAVATDTVAPPAATAVKPPAAPVPPRGRVITPAPVAPAGAPVARLRLGVQRRATLVRTGRLRLRVSLNAAGSVRVGLALSTQRRPRRALVRLARTVRFGAAGTRTVTFALSRAARARLRAARALRLEVALSAQDRDGTVRRSRVVRRVP